MSPDSQTIPKIDGISTISGLLEFWQELSPDSEAVIFDGSICSYKQLNTAIEEASELLKTQGLKKGDILAHFAEPGLAFYVSLLACIRLGGIWLGLNPKYSLSELEYIYKDAKPKIIWVDECSLLFAKPGVRANFETRESVYLCNTYSDVDLRLTVQKFPSADNKVVTINFNNKTDQLSVKSTQASANGGAVLIYTSGTTGKPKGALIKEKALLKAGLVQTQTLKKRAPRVLNNLPINHIGSIGDITIACLAAGGCVIMQPKFNPEEGFELIEVHGVTLWGQIPTMFQLALEHPAFSKANLTSIDTILFSGAPASRKLVESLREICPNVVNAYGMTETVGSITWAINASNDTLVDTIGFPLPEVELRLTDKNEKPLPKGKAGEIQVKSDYCFSFYWNNAEATAEVFTQDGFLKTGDMGVLNNDGSISLIGRVKERFKSGGYNVYPREIEQVILTHKGISDSVVVAVSDHLYFEVGCAFVLPVNDTEHQQLISEVRSLCKTHLANYKVPKYIKVLSEFPLLPNEKLDRAKLKAMARQELE